MPLGSDNWLREAIRYDGASRYLVFDRDAIFSAEVARVVRSMNIEPDRTSYRSPWQNGVAERFVGTIRRELLDHLIVRPRSTRASSTRDSPSWYEASAAADWRPRQGFATRDPVGRTQRHPGRR
jgi:hypothetical protein